MKWVLGLEWVTPGYMVREELKKGKMAMRAAKKAWDFEERLRYGKGNEWARESLKEIESREGRGIKLSRWEEGRRRFMEERGRRRGGERWERKEGREEIWKGIEREESDREKEERDNRIRISKYNRWYKVVREEEVPEYLKGGRKEGEWVKIARFRLGNEMREGQYWRKEEERKCRICEWETEGWEHVMERCGNMEDERGIEERVRDVLRGDGSGLVWMRELEGRRNRKETRKRKSEGRMSEDGWKNEKDGCRSGKEECKGKENGKRGEPRKGV
ncbi:cilia- and flagella-associated protein 251-like [Prorops nasuta]|uniref:cilia- and flagella-associated protein 251-like n=1 Tax=Prorops nasuta TaxID=863751 RepID=UPI0034CDDFC7